MGLVSDNWVDRVLVVPGRKGIFLWIILKAVCSSRGHAFLCVCVRVVEVIIDTCVSRLNTIEIVLGGCLTPYKELQKQQPPVHLQVPGCQSAFSFVQPKKIQLKGVSVMLERGK